MTTRRWLTEPPPEPIEAPLLVLDEPLSFWGGIDPVHGSIIDAAHPQCGASIGGCIVAMPGSRGSSGTPGVLGETLRRGVGPVALVITTPDINLVAGALVAEQLYGVRCPILLVDDDTFRMIASGSAAGFRLEG